MDGDATRSVNGKRKGIGGQAPKPNSTVDKGEKPKYKKKRQQCTKCPKNYSKREYLNKHMRKAHNLELERRKPGRQPTIEINPNDPRPYKCNDCVKEYSKLKHLTRHKRTHELQTCKLCNQTFTNLADHMLKIHDLVLPRPFECDICKKSYRTKSCIMSHMRIHRAENRIHCCTVCPKTFFFSTDLRKHVRSHSQNRSVICHICGATFKSADTLKCHMRRHTGERPYKCSQCPRAFTTSNSLDIHFRTHTGEKPFACEVCEKRFSDASTLHVHKRLHTNENPYCCHLCGRRTKQASNLRSHYKHFHKNNDITGRQIRLNSRIFARFSQNEIDYQLKQSGDLMTILEKGLQEFHAEENEKNAEIQKALEGIMATRNVRPTVNATSTATSVPSPLPDVKQNAALAIKCEAVLESTDWNDFGGTCNNEPSNECDDKHDEKPSIALNVSIETDSKTAITKVEVPDEIPVSKLRSTQRNAVRKNEINNHDPRAFSSNLYPQKMETVFLEDADQSIASQPLNEIKEEEYDNDDWFNDTFVNDDDDDWPVKDDEEEDSKIDVQNHTYLPSIKEETTNEMSKAKNSVVKNKADVKSQTSSSNVKKVKSQIAAKKEGNQSTSEALTTLRKEKSKKKSGGRCTLCKYRSHDLQRHIIENHSDIGRPFECFVCHRDYKKLEHLRYHFRIHGDQRDFICHYCGESYFLNTELRKHIFNRHLDVRPFKCQQCEKTFKNRHALNIHMRVHSGIKPYICAVCSEAFAAIGSLRIHERRHTGEKPYVCKFCNKAFADCSTHRQHERIHTGEKPYTCHLCGRKTAQAGNLKSHYRHYHKLIVKSVSMFNETPPTTQLIPNRGQPLPNFGIALPITNVSRIEE